MMPDTWPPQLLKRAYKLLTMDSNALSSHKDAQDATKTPKESKMPGTKLL